MDKDGIRPIDRAIANGNEVMVSTLLKKGAKLGPTTWAVAKGKPRIALLLLNKLLEDGNTLFRHGRLKDAAYRYEYALRRLPRLRPASMASATSKSAMLSNNSDIFAQLKCHLLLNLSRTKRKIGDYVEAEKFATEVLSSNPTSHEALWARAKAKNDRGLFQDALVDLREALNLAPENLQLHAFSMQVKKSLQEISESKKIVKQEESDDEDTIVVMSEV